MIVNKDASVDKVVDGAIISSTYNKIIYDDIRY
jgi:hypothetical protein